jgi:succinate dehydrogenase / fumarate reductase, iron-sulfur subunit
MLINGRARMACSALIDNLEQPVKLEPFSKFPIVRDLATDRSVIFENLKAVKAWVPIDGTYDLGSRPSRYAGGARDRLSHFPLHLLHLLHGGLSAVQ